MTTPPNGHYSKLYDEIAQRRDLSPGARILFTVVQSLARTSGQCYASNRNLARRAGLSPTQVKGLLVRLQKEGLISKRADGRSHREGIQVLWEAPEDPVKKVDNPPCQETGQGTPVKKVDRVPVKKLDRGPVKKVDRGGHSAKERANSQGNRGSFEPAGSKTPILEQTTGDPTLPVEGPRLAGGTDEGGTDSSDEGSPFDWVAFRESLGLSKKPKPGVIAFGNPEPVFPPEEAPIQDDPIIQAALAERREWQRRRAEQNGEAKP